MKRYFFIFVTVFIYLSLSNGFTFAEISENFDSYTADQAPLAPWVTSGTGVKVSNALSYSPPNSLKLLSTDEIFGSYSARPHEAARGTVIYEVYLRASDVSNVGTVSVGAGYATDPDNPSLTDVTLGPWVSMSTNAEPGKLCYGIGFSSPEWYPIADINVDTWYQIKLVVNVPQQSYDIYLNGTLVKSGAPFRETGIDELNFVMLYGANEEFAGYADNLSVYGFQPIPSLGAWGIIISVFFLAGVGFFRVRRKKSQI